MIDPDCSLPVKRQLELISLNASTYYYKNVEPCPKPDEDKVKSAIQALYSVQSCGYRVMHGRLLLDGYSVGEKVVRRLMRELNIYGVIPKRNLSKANKEHKKYPYLLRNLTVTHTNQVWATDITYVALDRGTGYLAAIIDLYSRKILSWRISNTLTPDFCVDALNEAFRNYGKPEIFNTDQGSQFTSNKFIKALTNKQVKISMDGKGRALDNIFIERFWRSIKYEYIKQNDISNMKELKTGVAAYIKYYNEQRPHLSLNKNTPNDIYFNHSGYKLTG